MVFLDRSVNLSYNAVASKHANEVLLDPIHDFYLVSNSDSPVLRSFSTSIWLGPIEPISFDRVT